MGANDEARPVFGDLLQQSQSALAGLQALEEQLSARLADQHAQLKAIRAELEQARGSVAALQAGNERLSAEHARSTEEAAHQRQARVELEAALEGLRRKLEEAGRQRRELAAAREAERHELEERITAHEGALSQRATRIGALEAQIDELEATRLSWQTEREGLAKSQEQLAARIKEFEAARQTASEELTRAVHNREQLRDVFEQLKQTHDASTKRAAAAFREMARLQDESRLSAERSVAQERTTAALKSELAEAKALGDEFQAHQLTWAIDREALLASAQTAEQRRIALEAALAKAELALAERGDATETEVANLREQIATLTLQLTDERERLSASLDAAREQLRSAMASVAAGEKARAEMQAQHAAHVESAQHAAQEWAVRRRASTDEARRLAEEAAQAQQARRVAEAAGRELERRLEELAETHRQQVVALAEKLKALEDAANRPLSADESHRLNTRLNAIVGFANILLDPKNNAITPDEQADFIRLISENSRGLAEDFNLIPVAGAAPAGAAAQPGPRIDRLGGTATPPSVLVADPDPAVRDRLAPFLTRAGYQVAFAGTTDEAVAQAGRLSPLIILAEAGLQPGGVPALIARLKRDPRTAAVPVVVTTRNLDEPLGVDLGQLDVLTKPIDRQQLLQVMINHDLQADARRTQNLPRRVLVIDDDPVSLRLLTAVLKPLHIDVATAAGGKAGIALARERQPDLIICDLMMPEVDGFDVINTLRSDPATSSVPILVFTGKSITVEDQQRLQGLIPSIIRKGEFSRERFLEFLLKRGERRARSADPPLAA